MKFTANKSASAEFLPEGTYKTQIVAITMEHRHSDEHKEGTDCLRVTFACDEGIHSQDFNLRGYKRELDAKGKPVYQEVDGQKRPVYQKDKEGNRLVDDENTARAIERFTNLAVDAGVEEGAEFDHADLIDCEVGIRVEDKNGRTELKASYTAERVDEILELAASF